MPIRNLLYLHMHMHQFLGLGIMFSKKEEKKKESKEERRKKRKKKKRISKFYFMMWHYQGQFKIRSPFSSLADVKQSSALQVGWDFWCQNSRSWVPSLQCSVHSRMPHGKFHLLTEWSVLMHPWHWACEV